MSQERTIHGPISARLRSCASVLTTLTIVLTGVEAFAQTNPFYVARQFPAPYAPLSGATVVFNFQAFDGTASVPIGPTP